MHGPRGCSVPAGYRGTAGATAGKARQHGLRVAGGNRHSFGMADIRQADKADAVRVLADRVGELFAGLEAFGVGGQGFAVGAKYQLLEGVEGAGLVITGVQGNGTGWRTAPRPVADLAGKYLRQLRGVQRRQRIAWMQDDGQAVEGDDLFGAGAFQVAQA